MCKKKCPTCGEKISYSTIFQHILLSVDQKNIECIVCNTKIKPNINNAIAGVALPQLFVIPFITNSSLSIFETIAGALVLYLPFVVMLFVCLITFNKDG